jgi:hypothetical protein
MRAGQAIFVQKIALLKSMYSYTGYGHLRLNVLFIAFQIVSVKKNLVVLSI